MRDKVHSFGGEGGTCALQEGKGSKDLPESVLEVPSLHEVELNHGKQDLPDFSRPGSAAGEPIMKERALLQVCARSMQLAQEVCKGLFCDGAASSNHDKQDLPDFSRPGSAAREPIMKERVPLQACALSSQLSLRS
jgi:hypothetical protein